MSLKDYYEDLLEGLQEELNDASDLTPSELEYAYSIGVDLGGDDDDD